MLIPTASDVLALQNDLSREFPGLQLKLKATSKFMWLLGTLLSILTLGQHSFLKSYTTTIGRTIYLPYEWPTLSPGLKVQILRHERVHLRQQKQYGVFLFGLLYLFAFFPVGFAWFRMKFEMEAYAESMLVAHEQGADIEHPALKRRTIRYFIGSDYGWMWPFSQSISKWYDDTVLRILRGR